MSDPAFPVQITLSQRAVDAVRVVLEDHPEGSLQHKPHHEFARAILAKLLEKAQQVCKHEFVDSPQCVHCGWMAPRPEPPDQPRDIV